MRHAHAKTPARSTTGAINRAAGVFICLVLALLCGYQFYQNEAYTRALETEGQTVAGVVISQTLRPCVLGDICYRRNRPNLTHVGHATIAYKDRTGAQYRGEHAINNQNAHRYPRGTRISVTYPRSDVTNATFGDPGLRSRERLLAKIFYAIGLLALLGVAFFISLNPSNEFADGR